eukprot:scaffold18941_cov31-Phaeocystis_antarctica.AAC.1
MQRMSSREKCFVEMAGAPVTQRKVRGRPSTKSGYVARSQPPSQRNTFFPPRHSTFPPCFT